MWGVILAAFGLGVMGSEKSGKPGAARKLRAERMWGRQKLGHR